MFLFKTETDLRKSFLPRDERLLELPRGLKFPLMVRDYLAWNEPGSSRVFLVFAEPDVRKPLGMVFERDSGGGPTPAMCEWCHSMGTGNEIGVLLLDAGGGRKVGVHLCRGLECREKIERDTRLSPMATQKKLRRVVAQMSKLARRTLF
ncbi:MAG: FBP domain-containing protein [Deltaproteobacteria bacterium]|nr:FBP domain-containing protein [Deltaproteobacteria bacterium]